MKSPNSVFKEQEARDLQKMSEIFSFPRLVVAEAVEGEGAVEAGVQVLAHNPAQERTYTGTIALYMGRLIS